MNIEELEQAAQDAIDAYNAYIEQFGADEKSQALWAEVIKTQEDLLEARQ